MHIGIMLHLTPREGQDAAATYQNFTDLVRYADDLGVEEAWVTEHHFQPYSLCPAPHVLMAHFLAKTARIRLGSAATLIGFHDPLKVAEELATLSALAPGRVLAGFAKGGPFEAQNRTFGFEGDMARARMLEAVPALVRMSQDAPFSHTGEFYQWSEISLQPRAAAVPVFLATRDEAAIALAAQHNFGLMCAQFWPNERLALSVRMYRDAHPHGLAPDLMASRGMLLDDDGGRARELALQHVHAFRTQKSQLWGQHQGPIANFSDEELLRSMLVGTPAEVLQEVLALRALGVTRLALNPLTSQHAERMAVVGRFMREVWPQASDSSAEPLAEQ